jgi:hypothetical protein
MARFNDPYMDDPYFRDALIINRSGTYTNRPKVDWPSQGKAWKWSILTVGTILILVAVAYSSYGGRLGTTGLIANVTMSTIDQGR